MVLKTRHAQFMALVIVLGCGSEPKGSAAQEEPQGPFRVVFEVDHADVYGSIEVEVEGNEPFVITPDSNPTCEDSSIVVDSIDFYYEALSERFFFWSDTPGQLEGGCIHIPLNGESLASGVVGFYRNDLHAAPCFPLEYIFEIDGRATSLGDVRVAWDGLQDVAPIPDLVADLIQRARRGEVALAGGGSTESVFHYFVVPPAHCLDLGSEGSMLTPIKDMILLFGSG